MNSPLSKPSTLSHSLLNVILVLIESLLTLVLRFDGKLRQAAYPLAKTETLVAIRSYLPHTQIYATFGYKGILLDDELPVGRSEADVVINAYSFQLINALIGHNPSSVDALQIRGKTEQVAQLKAFLLQVGVGGVIQNILHKIKGTPQSPEQKQAQKEERLADLKQSLSEKTLQLDNLTIENRKLITQLAEAKDKQKTTKTLLIIVSLIALVAIVLHFFI